MAIAALKKNVHVTIDYGSDAPIMFLANVHSLRRSPDTLRAVCSGTTEHPHTPSPRRSLGFECQQCGRADPVTTPAVSVGHDYIPIPPIPVERKPRNTEMRLVPVTTRSLTAQTVPGGKTYQLTPATGANALIMAAFALAIESDYEELTYITRWGPREHASLWEVGVRYGNDPDTNAETTTLVLQELDLAKSDHDKAPLPVDATEAGRIAAAMIQRSRPRTFAPDLLPDPHKKWEDEQVAAWTPPALDSPQDVSEIISDLMKKLEVANV